MLTRRSIARARRERRSGFTLIEILVVIVVIAILASVVAPEVFSKVGTARISTAKSQIEALGTALDSYRLANGSYPTDAQGLDALMHVPQIDPPPTWSGPYMTKAIPDDPWNRPYIYHCPPQLNPNQQSYDLYSNGKDGLGDGVGPNDENSQVSNWGQ
jgi:general secretion pathway protein G